MHVSSVRSARGSFNSRCRCLRVCVCVRAPACALENGFACSCGRQDSGCSGGSFGFNGGGGGGGGGGAAASGKMSEYLRVAFFDPDYDTSKQHLVKLVSCGTHQR